MTKDQILLHLNNIKMSVTALREASVDVVVLEVGLEELFDSYRPWQEWVNQLGDWDHHSIYYKAIVAYRREHKVSMREAKAYIDEYLAKHEIFETETDEDDYYENA